VILLKKLGTDARRTIRKALLALLCLMSFATTLHAHATLLQTDPPSGSDIAQAPGRVRLTFDERVEPVFNSLYVITPAGRRVDNGDSRVVGSGDVLEVAVNIVAPGPYIVLWKVNSADGHQVQGQFGFGFRSPAPDQAALQHFALAEPNSFLETSVTTLRWASLTALVVWLGGIFFLLGIVPAANSGIGSDGELLGPIQRRSLRLLQTAALAYIMVEIVELFAQTVLFSGLSVTKSLSPSALGAVLFTTAYGEWWLVRVIAAILLATLLLMTLSRSRSGSALHRVWLPSVSVLLGALMLLTLPLTGHARAVARFTWLVVLSDWVHLAATALWIGGLIHLAVAIPVVDRNEPYGIELLHRLASRFSRIAKTCALVLLATGIYAAWLHLPNWISFVTTAYGRALLAKLFLAILILGIAAVNLRRVLPAIADFNLHLEGARVWAGRFVTLLRTESILGVAILALVAVLTSLPPASAISAGPVVLSRKTPQATVTINLAPNRVGFNEIAISLLDSAGGKIADAKQVSVSLQMRDMDMALETIAARPTADGSYRADVNLSMAGRWSVYVEVSPARGDDFVTDFNFSSSF